MSRFQDEYQFCQPTYALLTWLVSRVPFKSLTLGNPPLGSLLLPVLSPNSPPKQQEQNVPSELSKKVAGKVGKASGPETLPKRF